MIDPNTDNPIPLNPEGSKAVEAPPVPITMIGTGSGANIMEGKTGVTPAGLPNIVITSVITPVMAIFIRFAHLYLVTLVGLVTAGMTPLGASVMIPYHDFWTLVIDCAALSVAGPALGALKDLITIFGRLEGKFPLLTGNI